MKLRQMAAVGATVVSLVAAVGCTGKAPSAALVTAVAPTATPSSAPATEPAPATTAATTTTTAAASPSVTPPAIPSLSGLPGSAGKPVFAVKIDDTPAAHPQTSVNDADLVYVEAVEGGATRLMAVFQSTLPNVVGPVRSGRETDLEILAAYGKIALAFSGAQPAVEQMIRSAPLHPYEEGEAGFFRSSDRYAPYNLYLSPKRLLAAHPGLPSARPVGLVFGPPLPGGRPATSLTVAMTPYVTYGFTYDAAQQRWLAAIAGRADRQADGGRLWATNVLVQQVAITQSQFHDVLGLPTPRSHTVGTGTFWLVRPDGTSFTGTWKRARRSSATVYTDSSGLPVTFAPGRTWILLAPTGHTVVVT